MANSKTDEKRDRFKTVASLLIATITVVGAIVAWRISIATGAAGGADSDGLAAALRSAKVVTNISTYLNMNLGFFAEYRQHLDMAELLEQEAAKTVDAARKASLNEQAIRERNLAAGAIAQVSQEYVRTDPAAGKQTFDLESYKNTQMAEAQARQNLAYTSDFQAADVKRNKARGLVGVTILFSAALFLLTASTTTHHRIRFLFISIAVPVFLVGVAAVFVLEMFW